MLLTKTVYSYDPATGYFTGATTATENPMNIGRGDFLLPANTTEIEPPNGGALTPRWTGENWELVDVQRREAAVNARTFRNMRLAASDWTQLPDVPVWVDVQAWRVYRQKLRDVPQQEGFPLSINWPDVPAKS
jgi:hypothetical protein